MNPKRAVLVAAPLAALGAMVAGAFFIQGAVGPTQGYVIVDPSSAGALPLIARHLDRTIIPDGGIPSYYADGAVADPAYWTYHVTRPQPHPCESTLADGGSCVGYWTIQLPEAGITRLANIQAACSSFITAGHLPDGGPVPAWCPKIVTWSVTALLGSDWDIHDANTRGISWEAGADGPNDDYVGQTP